MSFSRISLQTAALKAVSASDRHIADFFSSEVIPAFFLAVNSSGAADLQVREHRQTMLTSWPWKSRPAEKSIHGPLGGAFARLGGYKRDQGEMRGTQREEEMIGRR